jgi:hypothetical protein
MKKKRFILKVSVFFLSLKHKMKQETEREGIPTSS